MTETEDVPGDDATHGEDETVRFAPLPVPSDPETTVVPAGTPETSVPEIEADISTESPSAVPTSPEISGPKRVEGVEVDLDTVRMAVVCATFSDRKDAYIMQAKIWSTVGELMRQGVPDSKSIGSSPEETM